MACIKCSERMKLVSIEPQDGAFNLVTYRCVRCAADESFLKTI
jgi:DNA-directed RNA polymerase subunit RPC12/RpoP